MGRKGLRKVGYLLDALIQYIDRQKEHHKKKTFKDEFIAFLHKYNVDYDERYLWS